MDKFKTNPTMPISTKVETIPAPTTGTTGYAERIVVEIIDNNPKAIDAPKNEPAGWSAG